MIVTGPADKTAKVLDNTTGEGLQIFSHSDGIFMLMAIRWDLGCNRIQNTTVALWSMKTGKLIHVRKGHTGGVRSVMISKDGQSGASGPGDGNVRIWVVLAGKLIRTINLGGFEVNSVAISASNMLAVGTSDNALTIGISEAVDGFSIRHQRGGYQRERAFCRDRLLLQKRPIMGSGHRGFC